jgi:hypothetical protein
MGTLRYALLNALLTPLDEAARRDTPENAARDWLQAQVNALAFADDFRIVDCTQQGLNAVVEAEVSQRGEWKELHLNLEYAQRRWAVTSLAWAE